MKKSRKKLKKKKKVLKSKTTVELNQSKIKEKVIQILEGSGEFLANILIKGQENREKSKENLGGELLQAHQTAVSVIWSIANRSLTPGKTNESISDRLTLIASFIQGIDICETAISNGLYTQATALLKQELETIAAIEEISDNKRVFRKTPNVTNVKWELGRIYGFLNDVSHVANKDILIPIYNGKNETDLEGAMPVSVLPLYNKEFSIRLYSLHICLLIQLIHLMAVLYEEQYGEFIPIIEAQLMIDTIDILRNNGFLKYISEKVENKLN